MVQLRRGVVVGERYRLVAEVGRGGMGSVWRARRIEDGTVVAMKMVTSVVGLSDELIARMRREITVASGMKHPHVVRLLEGGTLDGAIPYLVMEYLSGQDLASLAKAGRLTSELAVTITRDLAKALVYVHEKGILHRDLKPGNVFLTSKMRTVLLDFGLAMCADQTRMTATQDLVGTMAYLAPEILAGSDHDIRTDIYGLGATIYTALSGRPRYDMGRLIAVARGTKIPAPPPLAACCEDVDQRLSAVIESCLAPNPRDRYQDAASLLSALEGSAVTVEDSLPALEPVSSVVSRSVDQRRRPLPAMIVSLLLGIVVVAATVTSFRSSERSSEATPFAHARAPDAVTGLVQRSRPLLADEVVHGLGHDGPDGSSTISLREVNLALGSTSPGAIAARRLVEGETCPEARDAALSYGEILLSHEPQKVATATLALARLMTLVPSDLPVDDLVFIGFAVKARMPLHSRCQEAGRTLSLALEVLQAEALDEDRPPVVATAIELLSAHRMVDAVVASHGRDMSASVEPRSEEEWERQVQRLWRNIRSNRERRADLDTLALRPVLLSSLSDPARDEWHVEAVEAASRLVADWYKALPMVFGFARHSEEQRLGRRFRLLNLLPVTRARVLFGDSQAYARLLISGPFCRSSRDGREALYLVDGLRLMSRGGYRQRPEVFWRLEALAFSLHQMVDQPVVGLAAQSLLDQFEAIVGGSDALQAEAGLLQTAALRDAGRRMEAEEAYIESFSRFVSFLEDQDRKDELVAGQLSVVARIVRDLPARPTHDQSLWDGVGSALGARILAVLQRLESRDSANHRIVSAAENLRERVMINLKGDRR